jgi:hypothetical protein
VLPRLAFTQRLQQVTKGMTPEQVTARLGKPDYVGHFESGLEPTIWFYGCEGPTKLPMLGSVCFDLGGKVSEIYGNAGTPPPESVITEKELRQALLLLDQAPKLSNFNPGREIRVVNGLLPLGKTKILAAITEYARVISPYFRPDDSLDEKHQKPLASKPLEALAFKETQYRDGTEHLLMLLRILFDIPGRHPTAVGETVPMPDVGIGAFFPPPPYDKRLAPRFPMLLINDIPLAERTGAVLDGVPEDVMDALPFFAQYGRLRTRPLRPTDHPQEVLSHLASSHPLFLGHPYRVQIGYGGVDPKTREPIDPANFTPRSFDRDQMGYRIKEQILKLLSPLYPNVVRVYPVTVVINGVQSTETMVDVDVEQWEAIMADVKVHPIRWNPNTNVYERLNAVR